MAFYRIVSHQELGWLVQSGFVPRNHERWGDYAPGTIICAFEADDCKATFNRFASAVASARSLAPGDKLYVLQFFDLLRDHVKSDDTSTNWPSSRICLDPVGIDKVKVVACMILAGTSPDFIQPGFVQVLAPVKAPPDLL
jgi:hypothetical protein